MKRISFFKLGVLAGLVLHGAALSLFSDALGRERFIHHVRSTWIDARITVPWAIALLIVVIACTWKVRRVATYEDKRQTDREQTLNMTINVQPKGNVDAGELARAIEKELVHLVGTSVDEAPDTARSAVSSATDEGVMLDAHGKVVGHTRPYRSRE